VGPIRLPGELAGTDSDPFAEQLDSEVSEQLWEWAAAHEDDRDQVGDRWITKADLWEARFRLGVPWRRLGDWHWFDNASRAAMDGEGTALGPALSELA
jgi:hypothetical protein